MLFSSLTTHHDSSKALLSTWTPWPCHFNSISYGPSCGCLRHRGFHHFCLVHLMSSLPYVWPPVTIYTNWCGGPQVASLYWCTVNASTMCWENFLEAGMRHVKHTFSVSLTPNCLKQYIVFPHNAAVAQTVSRRCTWGVPKVAWNLTGVMRIKGLWASDVNMRSK